MAKQAFKLRFDLLILDFFGTVLVMLGLAKKFAGLELIPSAYRFDETGWVMIGLGVLLMLPFFVNVLWQIQGNVEGKRFK